MHSIEIHTIILIMSVPTTLGLLQHLQNCSDYCKLLSNPNYNARSDCDCSGNEYKVQPTRQALRGEVSTVDIENSKIYSDPVKNNSHQNSPHFEQIYLVNPIPNLRSTDAGPNIFKIKQYHRRIATYDKNTHRKDYENSEQTLHDIITTNEIPLYLDIDLYEPTKNKTYHEVLGAVFENLRFIENNLSECLNLHIFIFSKNIDSINKTNTNWGHNVNQYDKLSNSEVLTEIQNKCNQTGNIVKQSLNDIKRWSASRRNSRLSEEGNNTPYDIFKTYNETEASMSHGNAISISKLYNEMSDLEGNIHPGTKATLKNNQDTKDHREEDSTFADMIQVRDYETEKPETTNNTPKPKNSNATINFKERLKNSNEVQNVTIQTKFNRSLTGSTTETSIDSTIETNTQYTNSDYFAKYRRSDVITIPNYLTNNNSFDNTITDATSRAEYQEGEYLIPKLITRELPNNTVQSGLDGYEAVPNSDFIPSTTSISTTEQSQPVTEPYTEQNIDFGQFTNRTVPQDNNDLEIKGHLYFLYGKHQIPARFIQEQDGNMHLAIDGFSLCEKYLQQNKKSAFMSLLCNCIVLESCAQN